MVGTGWGSLSKAMLTKPCMPRAVLLLAGTNDLMLGATAAAVTESLTQLASTVASAAQPAPQLFVFTIPKMSSEATAPGLRRRREEVNSAIRQGEFVCIDLAAATEADELRDKDGVHLNKKGYLTMGKLALEAVQHHHS